MLKFFIQNGGYDITWEVENYSNLIEGKYLESPSFIFGSSKEEWSFSLLRDPQFLECYIVSASETLKNAKFQCIACVSWNDITYKTTEVCKPSTDPYILGSGKSKLVLIGIGLSNHFIRKKFIFSCCLRDLSDISTSVKFLRFRSVMEAEYRRLKCVIPAFTSLSLEEKMHFNSTSVCKSSLPLIIEFFRRSYNWVEINIREHRNKFIIVKGKICFEDRKGEVIRSVEFGGNVLVLKQVTTIYVHLSERLVDYIKKRDNVLVLNFEFLVSDYYKEPVSWVEESYTVSVHEIQNKKGTKCSIACFAVFLFTMILTGYLLTKYFFEATQDSGTMYCSSNLIESSAIVNEN